MNATGKDTGNGTVATAVAVFCQHDRLYEKFRRDGDAWVSVVSGRRSTPEQLTRPPDGGTSSTSRACAERRRLRQASGDGGERNSGKGARTMDDTSKDWQADGTTVFKLMSTGRWQRRKEVMVNEFTIQVSAAPGSGRSQADAAEIAEAIALFLRQRGGEAKPTV